MTKLRWTRNSTFIDRERDFEAAGPGVYDVPDDAVEEYLDHRDGSWVEPEEEDAEAEADEPVESPPIDPADMTVDELEEALDDDDYDWNAAALRGLLEAERDDRDRDTAVSAIESRLDEE